jgi:hypothetical protein
MKTNYTGELEILPSKNSAASDFDFFHGKWKIRNRKLKERLKNCDEWIEFDADHECISILNGFGNTDFFRTKLDGEPFEAISLRLFDPKTRLWTIYWADSKAVVLDVGQVGSFDGDIGEFYAKDISEGTPVIVKFRWDKSDLEKLEWSQAFSADNGVTWEWNWYMSLTKVI